MQKTKDKSKVINAVTLEHNISEVRRIIADINKQKNFVNSLPFQLSLLKQLLANNQSMAILLAIEMLNLDLLETFDGIIQKQAEAETPRETLIIKIVEIISDINFVFLKDNTDDNLSFLLIKHDLIQKTKQRIASLSINLPESTILLLKIYRTHMQFLFTYTTPSALSATATPTVASTVTSAVVSQEMALTITAMNEDEVLMREQKYNESLQNCFLFLLKLIGKWESVPMLISEIFDMIKIIAGLKQFKEILLNDNNTLPEDFSIREFINELIRIISTTEICQIVSLGLQILDPILKSGEMKEVIREANPMSFILPLLGKFRQDKSIAFYACRVLSQIIEKEDIEAFLDILSYKRFEDFTTNKAKLPRYKNSNVLNELNEIYAKDEEMFKEMKKNIPRVLLLLSRDKSFRLLLNDMCSLECFIDLLESDLKIYDTDKESEKELVCEILPDFIKLLIALLKNYTIEPSERNKFLMKICYCFIRTLDIMKENKQVVYDIIHYFLNFEDEFYKFFLRDFDQDNAERIFINLLSRYYNMSWIFSFLHKCPILSIYRSPPSISSKDEEIVNRKESDTTTTITNEGEGGIDDKIFNNHCLKIIKLVDDLFTIFNEKNKEELLYHLHAISLQLILGVTISQKDANGINILFNESSLDLYSQSIIKLFEYVINPHPKCVEIYSDNNICSVMTLAFSGIENNSFSINPIKDQDNYDFEEKSILLRCDGISKLLDRLSSTKTLTLPILSYLSQRLSKLVEYKLVKVIKIIFIKESLCEFVIRSIEMFLITQSDIFLKEILTILNQILSQSKEAAMISKFISKNGMTSLMKVVELGTSNNDLTNSLSTNLNLISVRILNDANVMYESQQLFKNMGGSLKEIKFSKGLNTKVYTSLIQFFINIIKSCDLYDAIDELNLVTHLGNEYNDIFSFHYEDLSSGNSNSTILLRDCKPIQVIGELIALCLQNCKSSLTEALEAKLFQINLNILKYIDISNEDAKKNFDSKVFESIVLIIGAFIKYPDRAKESYNNPLLKKQLDIINEMIKMQMGNIDELSKVFLYFETMINYENNNIDSSSSSSSSRYITIDYIQEIDGLLTAKKIANSVPLKEMIKKCIQLLNNPEISRTKKNNNAENERILRELSLMTTERKSGTRQSNYNFNEEGMCHKPTLNTVTTQRLKLYYDKIMPNFNLLLKKIPKNALNHQDVEAENNNLSDILQMFKYFTKDEENIQKLIENDIITKLIVIVETDNIFSIPCQENGYKLLNILINTDIIIPVMITNKQLSQFILREITKIIKYYTDSEVDAFLSLKIKCVTFITSQLCTDKAFIVDNQAKMSLEYISRILIAIPNEEKEIIIYLLKIIKNILRVTWKNNASTPEFTSEKENLGEILLKDIWSRADNRTEVLLEMISLIEDNESDEEFINLLTDHGLLENLCQIFIVGKDKKNSSGFIEVLTLMNKLCIYRNFAEQLTNIGLLPIYNSVIENTFNKQILENCLLLFITLLHKDKKYINNLWLSQINEFCIKILSKYYSTCHQNIIKLTLELIVCLIEDKKNIGFFAIHGFDSFLKTLNSNIKNREIVLFSFIIINSITALDINVNSERLNRKNSMLVGHQENNHMNVDDNNNKGKTFYKVNEPKTASHIASSGISFNMDNEGTEQKIGSYDFSALLGINNDILSNYTEDYEVIEKLCQLLENIVTISSEPHLKILCFQVIISNLSGFYSTEKVAFIQLFFETLIEMFINNLDDLKNQLSCIIFTFRKVIKKLTVNSEIASIILRFIYLFLKNNKKIMPTISKEITFLLTWFINTKDYEKNNKILLKLHKITKLFSLTDNTIVEKTMIFIMKELKYAQLTYKQRNTFFDNLNSYCKFYEVKEEADAKELAELLVMYFKDNRAQNYEPNIMNILKIIMALSLQSLLIKNEFLEDKTNFITELQEFIKEQTPLDKRSLICQATACELHLKDKSFHTNKDSDPFNKRNMTIISSLGDHETDFEAENPKIAQFLKKETEVKYYNEKGEIFKAVLSMKNIKDITVCMKDKKTKEMKEIDSMNIAQMDLCVRSCSTQAFNKSKGFFKKPKAKNCFSIMGIKELNKPQKTFDIECGNENDCLVYVDYISMVIKNYHQSLGK